MHKGLQLQDLYLLDVERISNSTFQPRLGYIPPASRGATENEASNETQDNLNVLRPQSKHEISPNKREKDIDAHAKPVRSEYQAPPTQREAHAMERNMKSFSSLESNRLR